MNLSPFHTVSPALAPSVHAAFPACRVRLIFAVCAFSAACALSEDVAGGEPGQAQDQDQHDASAQAPARRGVSDPESYWGRKAEGWFFYADPAKEPELSADPARFRPDAAKIPLSTAWLRANLPRYLDLAMDNPTPENVKAFLYLQHLALDRASRFSSAVEEAVAGNPLLDENVRRPVSTAGARLMDARALAGEKAALEALSRRVSIIYLFDASDEASRVFSPLIRQFAREYGIYIRAARVTEDADDTGSFADAPFAGELASELELVALPAVFIFSGRGELVPLAQGLVSGRELARRLIAVCRREGILTPEEYEATLPAARVIAKGDDPARLFASGIGEEHLLQPRDIVRYFEVSHETLQSNAASGGESSLSGGTAVGADRSDVR
ncbi:MAG: conjugal transfer protein TraF [Succinivibrionaceae bacterium]|nr:conjugal transfer protein TraF [Succinivibrionaceae bacterium]